MPSRNEAIAILNPRAAGGKAVRHWQRASRLLEKRLGPVELRLTERSGHATTLTREALQSGCDLIIAVGGDGTVNEVANGFFDQDTPLRPQARLGLLPIGTGSDLQRTLQIPSDVGQAVDILANGVPLHIDVGKARLRGHDGSTLERYFVNLLSFGMGGDVAVRAKNFPRPVSGKIAFLYATVAVALTYRGRRVRLTLDGVRQPEEFFITNVAIGNGCYHGGGMHPCPDAVVNDGLLNVTTIDRLSLFELIRDLPVLYSDNVYRHPKVRRFRARRILAESDEITRIEMDGEALGALPLEISVLPGSLAVLLSPACPLLNPASPGKGVAAQQP